jgi:hypothetical protein
MALIAELGALIGAGPAARTVPSSAQDTS